MTERAELDTVLALALSTIQYPLLSLYEVPTSKLDFIEREQWQWVLDGLATSKINRGR